MKTFPKSITFLLAISLSGLTLYAQKERVLLYPFVPLGIETDEAQVFTDHLRVALFEAQCFELIEMPNIKPQLIAAEFDPAACFSPECLQYVGELSGTDYVIGGSIEKVDSLFTITAQLVNISREKIAISTQENIQGDIVDLMSVGVAKVARQLIDFTVPTDMVTAAEPSQLESAPETTPPNNLGKTVAPSKKGGFTPTLATCLIGPRVGLEMNEGYTDIPLSEWIALGGALVGGSAQGAMVPLGNAIITGTRAYMAYDRGGVNNGLEGALAAYCIGPRVGNEIHYRKIRTKEWLTLIPCVNIYPLISIPLEAYRGQTMSEIEIEEGLRKKD